MIYNKPTKADDGMRHVTAFTDEKKRDVLSNYHA